MSVSLQSKRHINKGEAEVLNAMIENGATGAMLVADFESFCPQSRREMERNLQSMFLRDLLDIVYNGGWVYAAQAMWPKLILLDNRPGQ